MIKAIRIFVSKAEKTSSKKMDINDIVGFLPECCKLISAFDFASIQIYENQSGHTRLHRIDRQTNP